MDKTRTDISGARRDVLSGTGILTFGIGCCAAAIVLVLAVAVAAI